MESISFPGSNHGLQVGISHGPINAEFHLPPERPETPPSPLSTVPFPRDPHFVSRNTLLHQIHEKGSVPGSRIALVGLGGVGKSQLAIEYSYRVRSESPTTWIFWVYASNEARFEQSFRDIADQVKIPGRQNPKTNIFKLVENWLLDEKRGKWICILDNADDDGFLCLLPTAGKGHLARGLTNASTKPLLEYIPRSQNGFIIITSRSKEVALKMVNHKDLIEVNPMESSEALELLRKTLDQTEQSPGSEQLVEELEFMPLAIVQAACLIRNRAPRYSISLYLRDFQGSDIEATKLLKSEASRLVRDWEANNSILGTWQISFDYIRHTRPSAADLLSLMSFFDRQGIPESLIRLGPKASNSSELFDDSSDTEISESDKGPEFEDDITTLRNYSFISVRGRWEEAEQLNVQVMESRKMKLGVDHPDTLTSMANLASTYWNQGRWEEAEQLNVQVMESRKMKLGVGHPSTLTSMANLASTYRNQGRWEEAEQLQVQVMERSKAKLGVDHPSTLTSMANLASTYRNQGRWEEAEQLQVQVMERSKAKLGVDHPSTLTSMANLASTYRNQGRWEEAEQLNVQVMETRKSKLGVGHPSTLTSMANLASTYWNQGRWEEAEQLDVQVMESRKMKLGVDHPDTLTSMANLASTYWNQGRWEEAEQLHVQVMESRKMKLGVDHPDTLTSMANLASTYWNQGRWEEAEQLNVQVMESRKSKLGVDHPDTLASMANLAFTWKSSGHHTRALDLLRDCLSKQRQSLGPNHPQTLSHSETLLEWEIELLNFDT
ncbi:hypothetical protein N7532_009560 [Penicillium argentinense]|uniref:Kinesin light chain n=1 Tax=Penicillium argentinense TaxID=1131581 RepID=A0A9W9EZT5_9EURO|nr:uncharacterized protein N7532_009560 [Penicillium argentinense]KAJ5090876.1 hypothetical protein N7532_009560 [Penicillium argentinense]